MLRKVPNLQECDATADAIKYRSRAPNLRNNKLEILNSNRWFIFAAYALCICRRTDEELWHYAAV